MVKKIDSRSLDVLVRFRVRDGEGQRAPEAVIDRLMRNGFEQVMDTDPITHYAIECWQLITGYQQLVEDAMAWRAHQVRRNRLIKAGAGRSPVRSGT